MIRALRRMIGAVRRVLVSWGMVHLLSLAAAAVVLVVANRNQWFFGDEWAFIADRGPDFDQLDLFTPHNDHWSTIPILIYWALLARVGLESYLPYIAVVIVLHLGLAHLLWRASLRVGARPAIATGFVGVFAVLGAGAENLLWAFQMGFVGAVAFGWAAVLLHDHDGRFGLRDIAGWIASIVALMFSTPALAMVGVATLAVWLRRRRVLDTVLAAAAPALVFGAWWWLDGRYASRVPTDEGDHWLVVEWAWEGLTHAAQTAVGVPESGGLLVLALLFWWARHLDAASGRSALAFAASVGSVGFFLLTATGRVSLGIESATASRYVYIAVALLMPAAALVVSRVVPDGPAPTAFVLGMCTLMAVHNVGLLRDQASQEMAHEQSLEGVVLASADLLRDDELPLSWAPPFPKEDPNLTVAALRRIEGYGWLPDEYEPTIVEQLTAEAALEIAFKSVGGELGAVSIHGAAVNLVAAADQDGAKCVDAHPLTSDAQVALGGDRSTWRVRLQGPADGSLDVNLVRDGDVSELKELTLPEGQIDLVSRAEGTAILTLPDTGTTTICGVAWG